LPYRLNVRAQGPEEVENIAAVERHMRELMRVPTVVAGSVMPDACPAGSAPGTIPVGGVASTKDAIHPGMHSADICCSMAVTVFGDANPTAILDAGSKLSHFGGGGRPPGSQVRPPSEVLAAFEANPFLKRCVDAATEHFATQGDGNHFFYVGRLTSNGQIALVTHHGSRKPGAMLYKAGMEAAEGFRRTLCPELSKHNAWIPADTRIGEDYWCALQAIRAWTKANHFAIHDLVGAALGLPRKDRFWNEHNFVFRKSDGLFYHAKGATPAWPDFAPDSSGLTLIPLNMAEPVLIARGLNAPHGLGFAPHGAGRNFSRTAYLRRQGEKTEEQIVAEQTMGIDARFFCGTPDLSELPGAYKSAAAVRRQITEFGLAEVVDSIAPIGCIMAGDWQRNAPWRKKRAKPK
jgi:RNA-splicing ligase RtcB